MTTPDPILDLTRWLKAHPNGDVRLELGHAQVEGLVAEWRRLQQSTDRLRKQNRKLRKRIDRLKAGEPDVVEESDTPEIAEVPEAAEVPATAEIPEPS